MASAPSAAARLLHVVSLLASVSALSVARHGDGLPIGEKQMDDPWLGGCVRKKETLQTLSHHKQEIFLDSSFSDGPCFPDVSFAATPQAELVALGAELRNPADQSIALNASIISDNKCDASSSPRSDFDIVLGHGNPRCRYEPTARQLQFARKHPEDIAIVLPSNNKRHANLPEDPYDPSVWPFERGVIAWRTYARYHKYAFYAGTPSNEGHECPGLDSRSPAWTKPCMAAQILKKHKFVLVVDGDTAVLKPRLRLEPLFDIAGLLNETTGKSIAVAEEWGSCNKGIRHRLSGDSNTGVILLRQSSIALKALYRWYHDPIDCVPSTTQLAQIRARGPQGDGAPNNDDDFGLEKGPCDGCDCLVKTMNKWSYDQLGFHISVASNPKFHKAITAFDSGCPINSPWADFIPHFVSGTPNHHNYHIYDRAMLVSNMHDCIKRLLDDKEHESDYYARCSICEVLPRNMTGQKQRQGAWSWSCPPPPPPA